MDTSGRRMPQAGESFRNLPIANSGEYRSGCGGQVRFTAFELALDASCGLVPTARNCAAAGVCDTGNACEFTSRHSSGRPRAQARTSCCWQEEATDYSDKKSL
jgi:hypothetical protein